MCAISFLLSVVAIRTWNMPMVATVLASAANYMICDDHEFTDDLGENVLFLKGKCWAYVRVLRSVGGGDVSVDGRSVVF